MKDLDSLALSKFKLDDSARDAIKPGEYNLDIKIRIHGTITVGNGYSQNITASVPWAQLLGVALSKLNGVTIDALLRDVDKFNENDIKESAKLAVNKIKDSRNQPCRGKVTHSLIFKELG